MIASGICQSDAAFAETVRLRNDGRFGHGYMFVDVDRVCRVATVAHNVETTDGRLARNVIVIDRFGREMLGTTIVKLDRDLDLAFLEVKAGVADGLCTTSRLGLDNLSERIRRLRDAHLDTTTPDTGEHLRIRVESRSISADTDGGTKFAVSASRGEEEIRQGMSGSPVLDGEHPLGLVVEAPDGIGQVLRFDIVKRQYRRWIASLAPALPKPANSVAPDIIVTKGRGISPESGPSVAMKGGVWRAASIGRVVEIELRYPRSIEFQGIRLTETEGRPGTIFQVETAEDGSREPRWTPPRTCRAETGRSEIECRILRRDVRAVRLRAIVSGGEGEIQISGLSGID